MKPIIRTIEPADNAVLAQIIRNALHEFGADRPGTVYFDPTTDNLYNLFDTPRSTYFVAVDSGNVVGGAGLYPSPGLDPDMVELVKMYLAPEARGKGVGSELMKRVLQAAKALKYAAIYLETLPELSDAILVYERFGFEQLAGPLGDTGHFGCTVWMSRKL